MNYIFDGHVDQSGKLLIQHKDKFDAYRVSLRGKQIQLTLEPLKRKRSNNQNRWYWGVVLKLIADYTGEDTQNLHDALKAHFAPKKVIGNVVVPTASRRLDTIEFSEYCEKVRRWAAEELSLSIPDPNEVSL